MKGSLFCLLVLFSLGYSATLTLEEIQKRLDSAFETETTVLETKRLDVVSEKILPRLEKAIVDGKIRSCYTKTWSMSDPREPWGVDEQFCRWWNKKILHVTCVAEHHQTCFNYVNH